MFSKIIKQNVVTTGNHKSGYVFISTVNAIDSGLETMVFPCNANGEVKDYSDLDCQRYDSEEEALQGHKEMMAKWAIALN